MLRCSATAHICFFFRAKSPDTDAGVSFVSVDEIGKKKYAVARARYGEREFGCRIETGAQKGRE
jgi:hypothetical protein